MRVNEGLEYQGELVGGSLEGFGILYILNGFSRGSRYEGYFKEGQGSGKGLYFSSNGFRFEGEFKNGVKHGRGIIY